MERPRREGKGVCLCVLVHVCMCVLVCVQGVHTQEVQGVQFRANSALGDFPREGIN